MIRHHHALPLLVRVLVQLTCLTGTYATTYPAPPSTASSVQDAVDKAAASGDTVSLGSGTHDISKGVVIVSKNIEVKCSSPSSGASSSAPACVLDCKEADVTGLHITGAAARISIVDVRIERCHKRGVYLETGTLLCSGSAQISNNYHTSAGGGIYAEKGAAIYLSGNAQISDNTATTQAGGIYMLGGTITMSGASRVARNTATTGHGGGIYMYPIGVHKLALTMSDSASVLNNSAPMECCGGVYLRGTRFESTTSESDFGAVVMRDRAAIAFNSARYSGGAMLSAGASMEMHGLSSIHSNLATTEHTGSRQHRRTKCKMMRDEA